MPTYDVYKVNEETGEVLEKIHESITDITPFKDGMFDKEGYLVILGKETREAIREVIKRK